MASDASIAAVRNAFSDVPRPTGFFGRGTCFCCECLEYNEILASHDRDSITVNELGTPACDPMSFANDEAFAYYIPAMVRVAFEHPHYMQQLVFHLTVPGRVDSFSPSHAKAVLAALWAWSALYLDSFYRNWETTGEIYRFDEAIRRLEAVAD